MEKNDEKLTVNDLTKENEQKEIKENNYQTNCDNKSDASQKKVVKLSINKTAKIFKKASVIIFVFCIIGAFALSMGEETVYKEPQYSWETGTTTKKTATTETTFSWGTCLSLSCGSFILCSAMYGLGEVIQLQQNSNDFLRAIFFKKE